MTKVQRRVIQAGVLAVVALACLAEVFTFAILPDRIVWQLSFPPVRSWTQVLVDIVPGSAFALVGLIAWSLRPRNRVGLLMMGVGIGLLIGASQYPETSALAATLGQVLYPWSSVVLLTFGALWAVVLIHLLLAFPGGRLVSRLDRALVRSFYVVVPLAGLLGAAALYGPVLFGPPDIAITNYFVAFTAFSFAVPGLIHLTCVVLGSGLVIRRWLLGGRARRRSLSPIFWSLLPIVLAILPWTAFVVISTWARPQLPSAFGSVFVLLNVSGLFLVAVPAGFLISLLRTGLDMSSVGDLVVKLSAGLIPEQLQRALAQALHDPSLEVAYWLPALGWFADLEGKRVELPASDLDRAVSVLGDPATPLAALVCDSSLVHEGQLLNTAAAAVHMALENARLQVQLRAQLEEVRQSRVRLIEAADSERQRVERDLHDGAQQQLVTLLLSMQVAKAEALRHSDPQVANLIDANIAALRQALNELRELARGIHPTILTQAGLVPAIRSLAERSPIPVEVTGDLGDGRLAQPLEAALYFVVAEAITNAVKHSKGQRLCVSVGRASGLATIEVYDDGIGGADPSQGTGLRGLSDRVGAVGGRLQVESERSTGTRIHVEVPCR